MYDDGVVTYDHEVCKTRVVQGTYNWSDTRLEFELSLWVIDVLDFGFLIIEVWDTIFGNCQPDSWLRLESSLSLCLPKCDTIV